MTQKKFSLMPGSITRFFILMVIVLLATMGVMIQSAVNTWLKDKSYQVIDVSHALHHHGRRFVAVGLGHKAAAGVDVAPHIAADGTADFTLSGDKRLRVE